MRTEYPPDFFYSACFKSAFGKFDFDSLDSHGCNPESGAASIPLLDKKRPFKKDDPLKIKRDLNFKRNRRECDFGLNNVHVIKPMICNMTEAKF